MLCPPKLKAKADLRVRNERVTCSMIKDTEFPNQGIPPKSLPLLHMKNHLQQYLYHLALILALCVCGILGSAEVSAALPAAPGVEAGKIIISDVVAERDGGGLIGERVGNFTKSEALHKFKSNPDGPTGIIAKISDLGASKMQDLLSDLKIINAQGDAIGDELLEFFLAADDLPAFERRLKAWEALDDIGVDQAIRTNITHLENVDGYFNKFSGRTSTDLATTANQFDNVEDYLNVLPDIVSNSLVRGTRFDDFESVSGLGNNFHHAEYSFHLWKSENWTELENFFNANSLNGGWPPNRGFVSSVEEPLSVNYQFDRYGGNGGNFVAPDGTPFGERALPAGYETTQPYTRYKVLREIPGVKTGPAIPWFGQPGLGIQHELPQSIDELLSAIPPYIEKIN